MIRHKPLPKPKKFVPDDWDEDNDLPLGEYASTRNRSVPSRVVVNNYANGGSKPGCEEKAAESDQKGGSAKEWACTTCTYLNPMYSMHCAMCGTSRPQRFTISSDRKRPRTDHTDEKSVDVELEELRERFKTLSGLADEAIYRYPSCGTEVNNIVDRNPDPEPNSKELFLAKQDILEVLRVVIRRKKNRRGYGSDNEGQRKKGNRSPAGQNGSKSDDENSKRNQHNGMNGERPIIGPQLPEDYAPESMYLNEPWVCPHCTSRNFTSTDRCSVCGSWRHETAADVQSRVATQTLNANRQLAITGQGLSDQMGNKALENFSGLNELIPERMLEVDFLAKRAGQQQWITATITNVKEAGITLHARGNSLGNGPNFNGSHKVTHAEVKDRIRQEGYYTSKNWIIKWYRMQGRSAELPRWYPEEFPTQA